VSTTGQARKSHSILVDWSEKRSLARQRIRWKRNIMKLKFSHCGGDGKNIECVIMMVVRMGRARNWLRMVSNYTVLNLGFCYNSVRILLRLKTIPFEKGRHKDALCSKC
jgi:hypothetical protein